MEECKTQVSRDWVKHCGKGRFSGAWRSLKKQDHGLRELGLQGGPPSWGVSVRVCTCLYAYESPVDLSDKTEVSGSVP